MAARVTLKQLRGIKLPPAKEQEDDNLTSLRKTLEFHKDSPEGTKICVPDAIADLLPEEPAADSQPSPDATLKS
jgi:hypothetical protein